VSRVSSVPSVPSVPSVSSGDVRRDAHSRDSPPFSFSALVSFQTAKAFPTSSTSPCIDKYPCTPANEDPTSGGFAERNLQAVRPMESNRASRPTSCLRYYCDGSMLSTTARDGLGLYTCCGWQVYARMRIFQSRAW
jgi:hypothetical protein